MTTLKMLLKEKGHDVWSVNPDDTVLIAGKGHETYQEIEGVVMPFDDREIARAVLTAMEAAH